MTINSFEDLNLSEDTLRAIKEIGYEEPTHIQSTAIPLILDGKDIIGQSQTGTGKTMAFGIPAVEKIQPNKKLQVLILCPTRELALQACEEISKISKQSHKVKALAIFGGQSIERQIDSLKRGVNIVIGTPGRIIDHINRKTIKLNDISMVVLDEADEMLNMGFIEDIELILSQIPENRQTLLFSATMSKEILGITKKYLKNPEYVKTVYNKLTVPSIDQFYFEVPYGKKLEVLSRLIDIHNPKLSLVFCNTKRQVDELVNDLDLRGYDVEGLHGDMRQTTRTNIMSNFKNGKIQILVATDVAARGIDADNVEAVFNYDIPQDDEYYVHRIGRTGRAGRSGKAFTFATGRKQINEIRDIQNYTKVKIKYAPIPSILEAQELKLNKLMEDIKSEINDVNSTKYSKVIDNLMDEGYTTIDIATALIKLVIGEEKEEDIIIDTVGKVRNDNFKNNYKNNGSMVRLFINLGKNNNIGPRDIVGALSSTARIKGKVIGAIDIYDKYSFVDVEEEYANTIIESMKEGSIRGLKANIEHAKIKKH